MGTTYYLVDAARKEVLDVGKWYALEADYGQRVTLAQLAAADPHPAVLPWADGRDLVVISDSACMEPWIDHDDPYLRWLPGWRMWQLVGESDARECFGPVVKGAAAVALGPPPNMLDSANHPGVVLVFPAMGVAELVRAHLDLSLRYAEVVRASVAVYGYGTEEDEA